MLTPRGLVHKFILSILILIPIMVTDSLAFGSKEKSPEEQAAENTRQATEKYNNGVKHMDKAKQYDRQGDSLFAFNYRATSEDKARKEYDKAVKDFQKATSLDTTMVEAFNNLGYCLRKLGELEESLEAYNNALAIDSLYPLAREYRGELFLALSEIEKARHDLSILKQIDSPYADTLSRSIDFFVLNQAVKKSLKPDDTN